MRKRKKTDGFEPSPRRHWVYGEKVWRRPGMTTGQYVAALEAENVCLHNEWKRLLDITADYKGIIMQGVENVRVGKRTMSGRSLIRECRPAKPFFKGDYWAKPTVCRNGRPAKRYIRALEDSNAAWRSGVRGLLRMLCETWCMIWAAENYYRKYVLEER